MRLAVDVVANIVEPDRIDAVDDDGDNGAAESSKQARGRVHRVIDGRRTEFVAVDDGEHGRAHVGRQASVEGQLRRGRRPREVGPDHQDEVEPVTHVHEDVDEVSDEPGITALVDVCRRLGIGEPHGVRHIDSVPVRDQFEEGVGVAVIVDDRPEDTDPADVAG